MEANSSYSAIESTTDVTKLLQLIEGVACDADEKKCPTQQVTMALRGPLTADTRMKKILLIIAKDL